MIKISRLSLLMCALSTIGFASKSNADWNSMPPVYDTQYYEEDMYPVEEMTFIRESNDMTWPLPYSDASANIDNLAGLTPLDEAEVTSPVSDQGWTGGPSYTPPGGNPPVTEGIVPPNDSLMPLANKELLVSDGTRVLSASMPPGYPIIEYHRKKEIVMETETNKVIQDSVRDWVAKEGLTLREVLTQWSEIEGWEVVWNTKREYPLKASAIFRGRYKDVAAAIIRSFSRSSVKPMAKFYLGNRVLVVKTMEENDED